MTVEFYQELQKLEYSKDLSVLYTFGATRTYNNLVRHISRNTQAPEGYLQIVRPGDPDYDDLPSNIFKSVNKLEITKNGLVFISEELSSSKPIRGVGPLSITPITIAFNALRDENE